MEKHNYHTVLCPTVKGWAETCTCADRLTFHQLTQKQQEQVLKVYAQSGQSAARFLYTVGDGKVIARVQLAKQYDEAEKENDDE